VLYSFLFRLRDRVSILNIFLHENLSCRFYTLRPLILIPWENFLYDTFPNLLMYIIHHYNNAFHSSCFSWCGTSCTELHHYWGKLDIHPSIASTNNGVVEMYIVCISCCSSTLPGRLQNPARGYKYTTSQKLYRLVIFNTRNRNSIIMKLSIIFK